VFTTPYLYSIISSADNLLPIAATLLVYGAGSAAYPVLPVGDDGQPTEGFWTIELLLHLDMFGRLLAALTYEL